MTPISHLLDHNNGDAETMSDEMHSSFKMKANLAKARYQQRYFPSSSSSGEDESSRSYKADNGFYMKPNSSFDRTETTHSCGDTYSEVKGVASYATNRLYELSLKKQEEGRMRRQAIERAIWHKNYGYLLIDHGVLPSSKADHMYEKGKSYLRKKKIDLRQAKARKEKKMKVDRKFRLADGAFAYDENALFQKRIYEKRYGVLVNTIEKYLEEREGANSSNKMQGRPEDKQRLERKSSSYDEYSQSLESMVDDAIDRLITGMKM